MSEWTSVEDSLPAKYCLAVYVTPRGQQRIIRAMYVTKYEIEATGDECDSETNDADDLEYIRAGWYELIDNWGDYSSVRVCEGVVTHWTPLPLTPDQLDAARSRADGGDTNDSEFKNFHRLLCERFGYAHDERDWKRDQLSLIEWIAGKVREDKP